MDKNLIEFNINNNNIIYNENDTEINIMNNNFIKTYNNSENKINNNITINIDLLYLLNKKDKNIKNNFKFFLKVILYLFSNNIETNIIIFNDYNDEKTTIDKYIKYINNKLLNNNFEYKTCIYENCSSVSLYNNKKEDESLFCIKHKIDGMVIVKNKLCKTYLCDTIGKEKYEGYCLYCFANLFPEKNIVKNYKTKERTVVEYILKNFAEYTWVTDKKIEGGCSRRRPDLLLDIGEQILIIEIDENQHQNYECICENKRLMEISQDLGHRPIIFIRFNPDEYIENNKIVESCWKLNKDGLCILKNNKIEEWNYRLNILNNHIKHWSNLENITNKTIEIIFLFYNII